MKTIEELSDLCIQIRRDILRMVHANNSGHPGGSLGCTEFLTTLYFNHLIHNTDFDMDGINEDLFFLSNGHISPVLYSVLARSGYFDIEELATFRKIDSRLQGHPTTHEKLEGIRVSTGYGWGVLRASNTQPALVIRVEAKNNDKLSALAEELKNILQAFNLSFKLE